MADLNTAQIEVPIVVLLTREPYSDFFQLQLEDGLLEEMEIEDTRKWFDSRGANMYEVEKVLDYVWNFYEARITIRQPIRPKTKLDGYIPKLS